MQQIQSFSPKRIFFLIQKTFYDNMKAYGKAFLILLGIFSVILFVSYISGNNLFMSQEKFYAIGLVVMGTMISGKAFRDLRTKERTMSYLSLPASVLEKTLAELIFTTVIFIIAYTAVFYIYNIIIIGIAGIFNIKAKLFSLQDDIIGKAMILYLFFQSTFFAGAASFRKKPMLSTGFVLFIFYIMLLTYMSSIAYIYMDSIKSTSLYFNENGLHFAVATMLTSEMGWVEDAGEIFFKYILPPLLWTVAYFKLKEKQV